MDLVVDILNAIGIRWQLVAAQLVGFLVVFAILKTLLFDRVGHTLHEREADEARRKAAAAATRKEVAAMQARLDARNAEIEKQAWELAQTEVRAGTKKKAEVSAAANEEARVSIQKTRSALVKEYDESIPELRRDVTQMTAMIISKALEQDVSQDARWTALVGERAEAIMKDWEATHDQSTPWGTSR